MQYETKQNLNVSCFVNFIKMGTAARNVNDKYIDPVKFGRLSVFPVGWRSEISHDTLYCWKMPLYYIFLLEWLMGRGGGGEAGGMRKLPKWKTWCPSLPPQEGVIIYRMKGESYILRK